jgi:Rrf2 family protein
MMSISLTAGYAIKAMTCLAEAECAPGSVKRVAACSGVPAAYLAKIFKRLERTGLVRARRGVGGGVWLTRAPQRISLLSICDAVDGANWMADCLLGPAFAGAARACPTAPFWNQCKKAIRIELRRLTLADVHAPRRGRARTATRMRTTR